MLKQKECTLVRYRELVSNLREELLNEQSNSAKKMHSLQTELLNKHEQSLRNLKEAAEQLCAKSGTRDDSAKKLDEIHKLQDALAEKEDMAARALDALKLREEELNDLRLELSNVKHQGPPARDKYVSCA